MTPKDLAAMHRRAFAEQGRAWRAAEFATLLADMSTFVIGDARAYALVRVVADEAEVLTLVCDPPHRRQGLASAILVNLCAFIQAKGATRIFLEVAADNLAAIGLYQKAGYVEVGIRKGYYQMPKGRVDAVVMEKRLS